MSEYVTELPLEKEIPWETWKHIVDETHDEWKYYPFEFDLFDHCRQSSYAIIRLKNGAVTGIYYWDSKFKPHKYPSEEATRLSLEEAKILCETLIRLDGGPVGGPVRSGKRVKTP